MARLRLRTFGGLSLEGSGSANGAPKGRRPLALLALLAASGSRTVSRDKVIALLWPESDAERGRNSLSQVLSSLRRDLGADDLVLGAAEIHLNPDAITSDVEEFEASVAHGALDRAVAIQSDPFLDGFYLTDAPEFERWVEQQRARLKEKQRDALQRLAVDADRRGDHAAAVAWWRRLAALDPTSARAAVGLMEALAASGDGAAALRHFNVYTALLEQELHAGPDGAVVELAERLRRGDHMARRATASPPSHSHGASSATPTSTVASAAVEANQQASSPRSGRNRTYAVAALVLSVGTFIALRATGVGPFATLLSAGRLEPNEPLLVADFKVAGPDSALSGPLAEIMRSGLSQSRVIEVVPSSRVASALARMERAPDSKVDVSLAREIAKRDGIKAVVDGTLTPLSGGYIITTRLILASSGDELASFKETAEGPRDLVAAVDRLSRKVRKRIGESLKSVRADPPLAEVTTASLDALEKYTDALRANVAGDFDRAIALLEEAVALDTNFAMAYRQIEISMNNSRSWRAGVGREQTSQSAIARMRLMTERAYQLRDRLPERERLQTISQYYGDVGDRAKARATYEKFLSKYPRAPGAANLYATSFLLQSREFARAESVYATLIAADTSVVFPYSNIVIAQIAQGKLDDARRSVERLARQFPNLSDGTRYRSELYYALGRLDSSDTILRDLASSSRQLDRTYALNTLMAYAMLRGQIARARPQMEIRALGKNGVGGPQPPLQDMMTLAQIQLVFFNGREIATRMLDRALRAATRESILDAHGQPYLQAASLYATAGRPDKAREMLALYDRDIKDTVQRRLDERDRKFALANVDLAEGRASDAVAAFRRTDLIYAWPLFACVVCIDPDVGRAFDRAGMPDSAIAVFENFVSAPSWRRVFADAWNLHWILRRLGELHEARGDREAAAAYYRKFVTLWKDADPELQPVVADVRRRLSRLEGFDGAAKD